MLGRGFGNEQFVRIERGRFMMGSALDADNPPHEVTLSRDFWLQTTPVTQAQWKEVMGTEPSQFGGDDLRPVEHVSWDDIQDFLRALAVATGRAYRLPTDAEWEYACRAGTTGDLKGDLDKLAWYKGNSGGTTQPVATRPPNAWGLYDMHGLICEWVQDQYSPLTTARITDPQGAPFGTTRVIRGGSWFNNAIIARSAPRGSLNPTTRSNLNGFRLLRIT